MPSLYLLVGLPAAGRTTTARRLAQEHGALRLTPDEWMLPLFGDADAGGWRDVLEGRRIEQRRAQAPSETVRVSVAELDRWREQFEAPDADEVAGAHQAPPAGWDDWSGWAQDRWPSLDVG